MAAQQLTRINLPPTSEEILSMIQRERPKSVSWFASMRKNKNRKVDVQDAQCTNLPTDSDEELLSDCEVEDASEDAFSDQKRTDDAETDH